MGRKKRAKDVLLNKKTKYRDQRKINSKTE